MEALQDLEPSSLALQIRKETAESAHQQVQRQIRDAIKSGRLAVGSRLPTVAVLSAQANLNRLTVLKALKPLVEAGVLLNRHSGGLLVSPEALKLLGQFQSGAAPFAGEEAAENAEYEGSMLKGQEEGARARYPLGLAYPPDDAVATDIVTTLFRRYAREATGADLNYLPAAGDPELRAALKDYLQAQGVDPDFHLMVTTGAQQALSLVAIALPRRTGRCLVEEPGYYGALAAFQAAGWHMTAVPQTRDGLSTEHLESLLRRGEYDFLYTTPSFNNPTGLTLREPARRELIRLCGRHGVTIVEDDIYRDLWFETPAPPPLARPGAQADVIHLGSFGKSFSGGLRIGYLSGPPHLVKPLLVNKSHLDLLSATPTQRVMAWALAEGHYHRHVKKVRRMYATRWRAMEHSLIRHLPQGVGFTRPEGGMCVWLTMPKGVSAIRLLDKSLAKGLAFMPGPYFDAARRGANCLRLNFARLPEEDLNQAMKVLGGLIRDELR